MITASASTWLPLIVMTPVLIAAGLSDLKRMRIPNWTGLAALALFMLSIPMIGPTEAFARALPAATIFAAGLGLWALRLFGAGDVKLLSALILLVPSTALPLFWTVLAASLLIGIFLVTSLRVSGTLRETGWVSMRAKGQFPMGVSIALSGIVLFPAWLSV